VNKLFTGQLIKGTNIEKNSVTVFARLCNELMIIGKWLSLKMLIFIWSTKL